MSDYFLTVSAINAHTLRRAKYVDGVDLPAKFKDRFLWLNSGTQMVNQLPQIWSKSTARIE